MSNRRNHITSIKSWVALRVVVDGMDYTDGLVVTGEISMAAARLRDLIGDGYAEVNVGLSMGSSRDYGAQKFDGWTTVKLTCDQSRAGVAEAHKEARNIAMELNEELLDEVESRANKRFPK